MADAPIRTSSRKGFIIGWIAIVVVGVAAFTLAALPMQHSHEAARLADNAYTAQPIVPRG